MFPQGKMVRYSSPCRDIWSSPSNTYTLMYTHYTEDVLQGCVYIKWRLINCTRLTTKVNLDFYENVIALRTPMRQNEGTEDLSLARTSDTLEKTLT